MEPADACAGESAAGKAELDIEQASPTEEASTSPQQTQSLWLAEAMGSVDGTGDEAEEDIVRPTTLQTLLDTQPLASLHVASLLARCSPEEAEGASSENGAAADATAR